MIRAKVYHVASNAPVTAGKSMDGTSSVTGQLRGVEKIFSSDHDTSDFEKPP
jgi:hypothetical protein